MLNHSEQGMPAILSSQDIERLTGFKKPLKQREFLQSRGYPFDVNSKGEPVVLTMIIAQSMGFKGQEKITETEPKWKNLEAI